jgi:hypothetical protein
LLSTLAVSVVLLAALVSSTAPFGALVIGFVAGGFTLVVGQYAFHLVHPVSAPPLGCYLRFPRAQAGYDATFNLAHLGVPK